MKTDKLFYRIFLSQPTLISELLPDIPANCEFDCSTPAEFKRLLDLVEAILINKFPQLSIE